MVERLLDWGIQIHCVTRLSKLVLGRFVGAHLYFVALASVKCWMKVCCFSTLWVSLRQPRGANPVYRVGIIPPRILTIREQEHGSPVRFGESDRARLGFSSTLCGRCGQQCSRSLLEACLISFCVETAIPPVVHLDCFSPRFSSSDVLLVLRVPP